MFSEVMLPASARLISVRVSPSKPVIPLASPSGPQLFPGWEDSTAAGPDAHCWETCEPTGADDGIRTRDPHLGKVMRYHCATSARTVRYRVESSSLGLDLPASSSDGPACTRRLRLPVGSPAAHGRRGATSRVSDIERTTGLEPATFYLGSRCPTSWATST